MPTVEKIAHNGHLVVTDIVRGQLIKLTYVDYTEEDALADFIANVLPAVA